MCCHAYVTCGHKKHVWSVGTCPTTILLSGMSECVNECCIERLNEERGIALCEIADLHAPQGVNLGGGGSPSRKSGMTQYRKWPKQEKILKHIQ